MTLYGQTPWLEGHFNRHFFPIMSGCLETNTKFWGYTSEARVRCQLDKNFHSKCMYDYKCTYDFHNNLVK